MYVTQISLQRKNLKNFQPHNETSKMFKHKKNL